MLFNLVSALAFLFDRSRTIRPRLTDRLGLIFSNSTDRFQMGIIAITGTVDHPAIGHGQSTCAQNLC
jgi:hypothetical protein